MAGLLYYLPNCDAATIEVLRQRGLGYAFVGAPFTPCRVQRGPDGAAGIVVADGRSVEAVQVGFFDDRQQWKRIPRCEAYVGIYRDHPPTPSDLARDNRIGSEPVELADGNRWLVPVVRVFQSAPGGIAWPHTLPTVMDVDDEGNVVSGEVVPRYRELYDAAFGWYEFRKEAFFRGFQREEDAESETETDRPVRAEFDDADLYRFAATILGTNYRVGLAEIGLLRLFDGEIAMRVLDTAIDWYTFEAYLKKKASQQIGVCSATGDGPPGSIPDTGPPSESSPSSTTST